MCQAECTHESTCFRRLLDQKKNFPKYCSLFLTKNPTFLHGIVKIRIITKTWMPMFVTFKDGNRYCYLLSMNQVIPGSDSK